MVLQILQEISKFTVYHSVGGGTAGSVLATRLSEDPVTVLVLEAGGSDLENKYVDIPLLLTHLQFSEQDWQYFTVKQESAGYALDGRVNYISIDQGLELF